MRIRERESEREGVKFPPESILHYYFTTYALQNGQPQLSKLHIGFYLSSGNHVNRCPENSRRPGARAKPNFAPWKFERHSLLSGPATKVALAQKPFECAYYNWKHFPGSHINTGVITAEAIKRNRIGGSRALAESRRIMRPVLAKEIVLHGWFNFSIR